MDAVIFDVDGTLTDTEPLHFEAANKVLARFGVQLSEEENSHLLGLDEPSFWQEVIRRFDLSADPAALGTSRMEEVLTLIREGIVPLPGIPELITGLIMRGFPLATASSSPRAVVEAILEELGLQRAFKVLVCGDQITRGKPEPDIFLKAAADLGISPENCMVFEDSPAGIHGARRAGMFTVAVQNRYNIGLDLSEADRIFSGLDHFDWTLV
jgi:HAD superfamily hydrolase (TIGR01509 family)